MSKNKFFKIGIFLLVFVGSCLILNSCSYIGNAVKESLSEDINRLEYKLDNMRYDYCTTIIDKE